MTGPRAGRPPQTLLLLSGMAIVVVFVGLELWAMNNTSYDVWGALLLGPALVAVSIPLAFRAVRDEVDPRIRKLIIVALVLKLASAMGRYYINFQVYGGAADSQAYSDRGTVLSHVYRLGIWQAPIGKLPGTGFIEVLTGLLYSVIGPTQIGAYLVFSWLGFWGLFLFYKAFCLAVPDGNRLRYARLVFLLPSLLYWSSSLGKEAWMMLTLGMAAYGTARLLTSARGGLIWLALGVAGSVMVRPHMALIVTAALIGGYALKPSKRTSLLGPAGKGLVIAGLVLGGSLVLSQVQTFFGASDTGSDSLSSVLDKTTAQTDEGGSQFTPKRVRTPMDLPIATLNVLFRPYPTEAHNAQALASSAEGMFLIGLSLVSYRRFKALPRAVIKNPYVAFSTIYLLLFVTVFSAFANFGILTRQRTQVFPFFIVFLCLPAAKLRERYRDPTLAPGASLDLTEATA